MSAEYERLWDATSALPKNSGLFPASEDPLNAELRSPVALALWHPFAVAASSERLDGAKLDAVPVNVSPFGHLDALRVACASLLAFVQANWTGPDLSFTATELLHASDSTSHGLSVKHDTLQAAVTDALARGGEPAYHLAQDSFLLYVSIRLLDELAVSLSANSSTPELVHLVTWWQLRAANTLNHVLDSPVSLPASLSSAVVAAERWLAQSTSHVADGSSHERWHQISARLVLEHGIYLQKIGQTQLAESKLNAAASLSGLVYHLTGALGKRTKWQKEAKTQLLLLARSRDEALNQEKAYTASNSKDGDADFEKPTDIGHAERGTRDEITSGFKAAPAEDQDPNMPSTYALNDDTLLEKTQYTPLSVEGVKSESDQKDDEQLPVELRGLDPNAQTPLTPFDQATLLALALNMQNSSADTLLTAEQVSAFVERVLLHPMNWSVYTMGLLLRSRLEANRTRTIERSVLQLQALLDQMATADSSADERLRLFFMLDLPSRWGMQAELAQRYLSIGSLRSSLEIYATLQMWEEVVRCLGLLSRDEEAKELVRDLLAGRKVEADEVLGRRRAEVQTSQPTEVVFAHLGAARAAKLWCLLGDLEPDQAEAHYHQAWETSQGRSAKAARSLGGWAFRRSEFDSAITWFTRALALNPLFSKAWFVLGCAYMRQEKFGEAVAAFRRSTALDEEDAEAWNNLASCYLQLDGVSAQAILMGKTSVDALPGRLSDDQDRPDQDSDDEEDNSSSLNAAAHKPDRMKKLAHKALSHALTHKRDSWRVWTNYLVVSVDVGDFLEAAHALGRVVEIRAAGGGADGPGPGDAQARGADERAEAAIDFSSLQRLVGSAVRAGQSAVSEAQEASETGAGSQAAALAAAGAAHARTLLRAVFNLFDSVLLPRVSHSCQLWQLYARLLLFQGAIRSCIEAHMRAWLSSEPAVAAEDGALTQSLLAAGTELLKETTEVMENLSLRPAVAALTIVLDSPDVPSPDRPPIDPTPAMKDWKFKARSLVRTFAARSRDFEDTPEWAALIELRDSLK